VAVVGSSTVLAIQYFRRKTIRARWLMAVAGFVFLLGHTVPWHFAFAMEQWLSPNPGAGSAITAKFDPSGSKFRLPEGLNHNSWFRGGGVTRDEASTIYLPIRVAGLAESTVLNADRQRSYLPLLMARWCTTVAQTTFSFAKIAICSQLASTSACAG